MSIRRGVCISLLFVLFAASAVVSGSAAGAPAKRAKTVTISGTAYEFGKAHTFLAGATVGVLEDRSAKATVAADGTYSITVRDAADVTPYIVADGYGTIYLQTFHTDGANLVEVNFQTPTRAVMPLLAYALHTKLESNGYPRQCSIVTTIVTKQVRGVSYEQFVGWGAHGVAGVVAHLRPAKGTKLTAKQRKGIVQTYFDEGVQPDDQQFPSSKDGGVGWTHVPPGRYVITGQGAGSAWAPVHVTCANGRIVNANPPWGLHQLATTIDTTLATNWTSSATAAPVLRQLELWPVPTQYNNTTSDAAEAQIDYDGSVTVSCTGPGCFEPVTVAGSMTGHTDVLAALGDAAARIRGGQTIRVEIAVPGYNTRVETWSIPDAGRPSLTYGCIPLGDAQIQRLC
jgi:hypothetical protein